MHNIVLKDANHSLLLKTNDYLYNEKNVITINSDINKESADNFILDIYSLKNKLENQNDNTITIYLNSLGGETIYGLAIIDAIEDVKKTNPIEIICYGYVASMAAIIASCGSKRRAYKNTKLLIHEILITGNKESMNLSAVDTLNLEMKKHNEFLAELLARNTHKTKKQVLKKLKEDKPMSSEEALQFGLIDEII